MCVQRVSACHQITKRKLKKTTTLTYIKRKKLSMNKIKKKNKLIYKKNQLNKRQYRRTAVYTYTHIKYNTIQ